MQKSVKRKRKNKKSLKNKKYRYKSRSRSRKGGAPWRLSVNSYTELQKYLDNNKSWITPNTRIWIVKNTDNKALYESNTKDLLESLYDHGITPENISEYSFNIL
jgi:hypothetical protein